MSSGKFRKKKQKVFSYKLVDILKQCKDVKYRLKHLQSEELAPFFRMGPVELDLVEI